MKTREEILCKFLESHDGSCHQTPGVECVSCYAAAEINHLRELVADLRLDVEMNAREHARVEKARRRPDQWRDLARSVNDPRSPTLLSDCADELEADLE